MPHQGSTLKLNPTSTSTSTKPFRRCRRRRRRLCRQRFEMHFLKRDFLMFRGNQASDDDVADLLDWHPMFEQLKTFLMKRAAPADFHKNFQASLFWLRRRHCRCRRRRRRRHCCRSRCRQYHCRRHHRHNFFFYKPLIMKGKILA